MTEKSTSFGEYLDGLPAERRAEVEQVWRVVRDNIGDGYVESIGPKFLCFQTDGEWYVALANQKNYVSLYLMPVYVYPELKARLDESGKKLKMGKSCINFRRAEELPLEIIGEIVGAHDAAAYRKRVLEVRNEAKKSRTTKE